jgi:hypothetical protein
MGSEFTFYDYIDADKDGANVIKEWLNSEGKDAKAHFINIIPHVEASPPAVLTIYAKPLKNKKGQKWDGFLELRKRGKVNFRLIFKIEGRNLLLVACGIHKGHNYITNVSPQTALNRVAQMVDNLAKYGTEHEYD